MISPLALLGRNDIRSGNKDSAYKESKDIKGKTIKLVDELNDKETIERSVDKKVDVEFEYVETITDLLPTLQTDKELILLVNSGTYDAMNENDELLQKSIKKIHSIIQKNKYLLQCESKRFWLSKI